MTEEQARVLARAGNTAVVHLTGRAFPGIHLQGDTFAALHRRLADTAIHLRRGAGDDALDELDDAVSEMFQMLRFYEATLNEHQIRLPYVVQGPD